MYFCMFAPTCIASHVLAEKMPTNANHKNAVSSNDASRVNRATVHMTVALMFIV
jgi:hypothetical protein